MARAIDRNIGMLDITKQVPDTHWVLGAIVVSMNEDAEVQAHFVADSLEDLPIDEVQEELGAMAKLAWELAAFDGVEPE